MTNVIPEIRFDPTYFNQITENPQYWLIFNYFFRDFQLWTDTKTRMYVAVRWIWILEHWFIAVTKMIGQNNDN